MKPPNSSTSSSDASNEGAKKRDAVGPPAANGETAVGVVHRSAPRHEWRETIRVAAWFLLFLAAADAAVNFLLPLPRDPRRRAGALGEYFNYGLSIEAKIRRMVGPTDETSAPLALAGWVDKQVAQGRGPAKPPAEGVLISFYGMSFSNDVARALAEIDPKIRVRLFAGPAAPPNHSYAVYSLDRGGPARVVVLGILGSSVPGLVTNNGMTWRFEGPAPFTYPRYDPGRTAAWNGKWPFVRTLADLRGRLADVAAWDAYASQLQETDAFYNRFLFRHDLGDRSTLVRMVRRAVAQRWQSSRIARIHSASGFIEPSDVVASLRWIVAEFAARARSDGKLPVALLIQDQGYRNHVYLALAPVLNEHGIAYLSTHTICPDTDRRNFVADGHFTHEANQKIAHELRELIFKALGRVP